jgi:predicted DNA-binding transcriptional regulator YafY
MRADRLVAILLLMQARGRVTAGQVAAELEVSVATARRDLEALSAAGVPVYPQPGKGGGWSLVGGARTDLSGLTAGEARALFLPAGPGAGGGARGADPRHGPELRSAIRKLVQALPETFRAEAAAAAQAVVVDPARWGSPGTPRDPVVDLLADAVVRRRKVRFGYGGRERLVDPWGLVDKAETWYLLAGTPSGRRTFRVDRAEAVELTDLAADRPAELSLARAWQETVETMERHRCAAVATATCPVRLVPVLRSHFGRHCEVVDGVHDADLARVRISAQDDRALAEQLAGWVGYVDVEGPVQVREALAAIGRRLVERYA